MHIESLSSREALSRRYAKKRWADFLTQDKDGVLHVEGVSVEHLARKYGTPHFILVEREIRERLQTFKKAFPYHKLRPQFACKVNSNLEIIRIAKEEGFELDASSVGEIILGLLADYKPSQITFTNLYKSHQDIAFAAMIGVQAITADSMEELQKIAFVGEKLGLKINLFLRLNPLIDLGNYTTRYQQYGIPYPDAKKAVDYAMKHPHLELTGFHFHGSYITNPQVYIMAAEKLLKISKYAADHGAKIKYLDLGGGLGTSIRPIMSGVVAYAGWDRSGYGNLVILEHKSGIDSYYAHLSKINVKTGQSVDTNTEIGKMGATGRASGVHLHLEVHQNGVSLNPLTVLSK